MSLKYPSPPPYSTAPLAAVSGPAAPAAGGGAFQRAGGHAGAARLRRQQRWGGARECVAGRLVGRWQLLAGWLSNKATALCWGSRRTGWDGASNSQVCVTCGLAPNGCAHLQVNQMATRLTMRLHEGLKVEVRICGCWVQLMGGKAHAASQMAAPILASAASPKTLPAPTCRASRLLQCRPQSDQGRRACLLRPAGVRLRRGGVAAGEACCCYGLLLLLPPLPLLPLLLQS